ncbi:MAG: glycosyltransferase family 4 protein [Thermoactinomyces sp.]
MRILIATYFALPHIGGIWTYVSHLKQYLERLGHKVDILARHPKDRIYYMLHQDTFFKKEDGKNWVSSLHSDRYHQIQLASDPFIKNMELERYIYEAAVTHFGVANYDLIHTQDIISTRAIAKVKPKQTPLILTIHGYFTEELLIRGIIKSKNSDQWKYSSSLEYHGLTSSDFTIFPSLWMKNIFVQEINVPDRHLEVIPNGLDIENFIKNMKKKIRMSLPSDKKVIVCVARLEKLKGHKYLLDALAKLKQERTDWICWIVGQGYLQKELEQQCKKLQLDRDVLFLGVRNDVPALLKRADVCVLPSLQENCPYFVMESQIAGKPIIASAVGGIPEMIQDGCTGLLSQPGQSESLYLNLRKILKEDTLRAQIANNTENWGRTHWSLDTMVKRTLTVYERALRKKYLSKKAYKKLNPF